MSTPRIRASRPGRGSRRESLCQAGIPAPEIVIPRHVEQPDHKHRKRLQELVHVAFGRRSSSWAAESFKSVLLDAAHSILWEEHRESPLLTLGRDDVGGLWCPSSPRPPPGHARGPRPGRRFGRPAGRLRQVPGADLREQSRVMWSSHPIGRGSSRQSPQRGSQAVWGRGGR